MHSTASFTVLSLLLTVNAVLSLNTFISNNTHWKSTSNFQPSSNTIYGNITLHKALRMEFDFIYYGGATDAYEGAFRLGYPGNMNCNGAGIRLPAIFINHNDDGDHILITISRGGNGCWDARANPYSIQPFQPYHIIIQFNQTWRYIEWSYMSTTEILLNEETDNPIDESLYYTQMNIWMNDGYTQPPNVTLSNIVITTWDPITSPPTMSPTSPSLSPSIQPTTLQPTEGYPTITTSNTPESPPTAISSTTTSSLQVFVNQCITQIQFVR